ncbi:MAG: cyclic nucleotide-binding domain-containing protein [Gammaproteobacteria bacterium]|nr:cyclic nucleotide-binding domain-containing protein [Gammaproteobacteria bacterium]
MSIEITIAKTTEQTDEVLKIRHKVFCEEEGKFQATADGRVLDRFDAYSTTRNLVVITDGQVVGSMRMTLDSAMGVPADEYYDFRSHLPPDNVLMNCGMYCITKPFRSSRIALGMQLMASYFAISHNVTHVVAPINPAIAKLQRRTGFKILGEELIEPHTGLAILPTMLDMRDLNDYFVKFAQRHQLQNILSVYNCVFYQAGEYLIRAGEKGDCAYVIVEGEAEVKLADSDKALATKKQGDVIGELALLTDDIRSADVVAKTDLRVMTLSKAAFMEHFIKDPQKAADLMKNLGAEVKTLLKQII